MDMVFPFFRLSFFLSRDVGGVVPARWLPEMPCLSCMRQFRIKPSIPPREKEWDFGGKKQVFGFRSDGKDLFAKTAKKKKNMHAGVIPQEQREALLERDRRVNCQTKISTSILLFSRDIRLDLIWETTCFRLRDSVSCHEVGKVIDLRQ